MIDCYFKDFLDLRMTENSPKFTFDISDSSDDDNVDDDDEPKPKRRKTKSHEVTFKATDAEGDVLASDVYSSMMARFLKSDQYKKYIQDLKDDHWDRYFGTDGRILPFIEIDMEADYKKRLSDDQYNKMNENEKVLVASIIDDMNKQTEKYYTEDLKNYDHTTITRAEEISWTNLCQKYSDERRIQLGELDQDEQLLPIGEKPLSEHQSATSLITELNIRRRLVFLNTIVDENTTVDENTKTDLFERRLNDYDYLCISVGNLNVARSVLDFIKLPPIEGRDNNPDHSIVLMIDKQLQTIDIFDSSQFYTGGNIAHLLFSLLAPPIYTVRDEDGKPSYVTKPEQAEWLGVKNKLLAIFIINTLFKSAKPSDFFSLPGTDILAARDEFETIVKNAMRNGWSFGEYAYAPQLMFQVRQTDEIMSNGYCGTYSAWFCWLCTLNPYNILHQDTVRDPPAHNIKAFAAYIRRCIKLGRIAIPKRMLSYMKPIP